MFPPWTAASSIEISKSPRGVHFQNQARSSFENQTNFPFVDGVAPRAKMNQQRSRRFRSAQEAKEKDDDKEELLKMLRSRNGGQLHEEATERMQKKTWDSNAITPGTPFMGILAVCLRYWCAYKINKDPAWEKANALVHLS